MVRAPTPRSGKVASNGISMFHHRCPPTQMILKSNGYAFLAYNYKMTFSTNRQDFTSIIFCITLADSEAQGVIAPSSDPASSGINPVKKIP